MNNNLELIKLHYKYMKILNMQKLNREKYQLIDTGKEIIENFNISLLPNFNDYKDPYINLELKYMKLITDLDMVNENLTKSFEIWNKIHNDSVNNITDFKIFNTYYFNKLNKLNEYIAYDLKKFIDEVLSIICVIKNQINNGKLSISSIGSYLNKHNSSYNEFDDFLDLFTKLNDLINAYKHSYANTDFPSLGRKENCFTALYIKNNDFSKKIKILCVSVNYIVNEFNKFYKKSFELIDTLTQDSKNTTIK